MTCHRCTRREFLANAAGLGALATVASCGDGVVSSGITAPIVPPVTDQVVITVSDFPQLATVGTLVKVSSFFAAKRTGPTTFEAFSMACTHQGCLTNIVNGQRFDCPCHFSQFDANGNVTRGPARDPLQKLPTSYDQAADRLTIN